MKRTQFTLLIAALMSVLAIAQEATQDQTGAAAMLDAASQPVVRFAWVDVFVDSADQPLAAYQFELTAATGDFKIVGVEGGEHPAFAAPPYYDPAALQNDRIIIAAFNTSDDLPTGQTRVARIHVQITGVEAPEYIVSLTVAAGPDGQEITAIATLAEGETK